MGNRYDLSKYISVYEFHEIYISNKKMISELYSDQIDYYDGLIKDIKDCFILNSNSGYNDFGCEVFRFYRGDGIRSPIYRKILKSDNLLSYL